MTYSEQLKQPLWQKKRLEIFQRDNWTCKTCKHTDKQLHAHHGVYLSGLKAWEYDDKYLHTLCFECHIEAGLFVEEIHKLIGETDPHLLWDLEWIFKWVKAGHAESLRKWIIDTENKTL